MAAYEDVACDLDRYISVSVLGGGGGVGGFGEELVGLFLGGFYGLEVFFVGFDFVVREDGSAGYGVRLVLLGWEEGDVVAETRGLDDHEVGAGAGFFDEGDAVGGLGVAVELPRVNIEVGR